MELVGLLGWWYTAGWKQMVRARTDGLAATADYFSLQILFNTLFAPFRQISASGAGGPFAVRVRAFFDNMISRSIGAIVRLIVIVIGALVLIFQGVLAVASIVLWAVVPLMPFIGAVAAFIGWVPTWR